MSKLDQILNFDIQECIVPPQKNWAQKTKKIKNFAEGLASPLGKGGLCRGPST